MSVKLKRVGWINKNKPAVNDVNLKQLENNVEDAINRQHNLISVGFLSDYSMTSSNWTQKVLTFNKTIKQVGSGLTLSNGKVKIGAGIKSVKVSLQAIVNKMANDAFYDVQIRKNGNYIASCSGKKIGDPQSWSFAIAPVIIDVAQNDLIEVSAYIDSATFTSGGATQFVVETLENDG